LKLELETRIKIMFLNFFCVIGPSCIIMISTVRAEESFFKQKARIQWLSLGDQNTSYFHKSVNGRQNRNKLLSLTREDGEVVEGHEAVKSEVIAYFHRVLGVDQMPRVLNEEVVELAINLKLSSTQQHVLAQDVTREGIKHAMFSLKNVTTKPLVRMALTQVSSKECGT
jgi:hypothetical protein